MSSSLHTRAPTAMLSLTIQHRITHLAGSGMTTSTRDRYVCAAIMYGVCTSAAPVSDVRRLQSTLHRLTDPMTPAVPSIADPTCPEWVGVLDSSREDTKRGRDLTQRSCKRLDARTTSSNRCHDSRMNNPRTALRNLAAAARTPSFKTLPCFPPSIARRMPSVADLHPRGLLPGRSTASRELLHSSTKPARPSGANDGHRSTAGSARSDRSASMAGSR